MHPEHQIPIDSTKEIHTVLLFVYVNHINIRIG